MDSSHFACVLAGGSGERFWPMSRQRAPKHLLRLLSDRTLLEDTVRRLRGVVPRRNIFVLTNKSQAEAVRAALPFLRRAQILAEPAKRDTAPAAALATALVRSRDPKGVVALLPADHVIGDAKKFSAQLSAAFARAGAGDELITFAIKPSYPATGFGYLELGGRLAPVGGAEAPFRRVSRFVEKPGPAAARRYVESGRFGWNSGIFVWSADAFLAEARRQAPALEAFVRGFPRRNAASFIASRFPRLPKISIDYAIMEKARKVVTLVARFDWDDVGTWTSLGRHLPEGPARNAFRGAVAAFDSTGNIAISNGRVIGLCGVRDLIVVETGDAVLVCHRAAAQDVKKLLPLLPREAR
jgi:mannose-1-phosphate guanylyltransferase